MGRIRTIKPELALHEGLFNIEQRLGMPVRFFWAMLPTVCDREGRFKWRPKALKMLLLPYDEDIDVAAILDALWRARMLTMYGPVDSVRTREDLLDDGDMLGAIPTFLKHQNINNREQDSELPDPGHSGIEIFLPEHASSTRQPRVSHASSTRQPRDADAGCDAPSDAPSDAASGEGKGREGKGREGVVCAEPQIDEPSAVEEARFCAEPEDDPSPDPPPQPAFELPVKGGKACPIDQETYDRWVETYDPVDVRQSLANLREWLLAHPQRMSTTPRGTHARAVNWLKNDHERAIKAGASQRRPAAASGDDPRSQFNDIFGPGNR